MLPVHRVSSIILGVLCELCERLEAKAVCRVTMYLRGNLSLTRFEGLTSRFSLFSQTVKIIERFERRHDRSIKPGQIFDD
jgi:hypothetical protein